MVRREPVQVLGYVLYCDGCNARGGESVHDDNCVSLYDGAPKGWEFDDDNVFCGNCVAGAVPK